jgi:DNA polymerase-3 subunit beta
MKVICDRGALLEALNLVSPVVVSRTPKPVLQCVKLTADDQGLTLAATDLEAAIRVTTARVEVAEPGEALCPADKLSSIVRESLDPTLTLETDGEATHIRGQDAHYKVYGYPPGDFPPLPVFKGDPEFIIQAGMLNKLVHQTIYATARENSRYAINGVLVERDNNKLTIVATDGHRLALARGDCKGMKKGDDAHPTAIVPTKALNLLMRLLGDEEEDVQVQVSDNQVLFITQTAMLASNLVEGNFPPYKDVIPKDGDRKATMATDLLASAVRRAALLTNEESKGVKLAFTADGLVLSSRAPEMGEAEVNVEVAKFEGEPIEIGFNPHYVLDALKVADADQVQLDMKAPNKPGVLRTGTNFLYVVMPVNLN